MNEMQKKAYEFCKNHFSMAIELRKRWEVETKAFDKDYYLNKMEEEAHSYSIACEMYEKLFDEEFILTDEDRKEILG